MTSRRRTAAALSAAALIAAGLVVTGSTPAAANLDTGDTTFGESYPLESWNNSFSSSWTNTFPFAADYTSPWVANNYGIGLFGTTKPTIPTGSGQNGSQTIHVTAAGAYAATSKTTSATAYVASGAQNIMTALGNQDAAVTVTFKSELAAGTKGSILNRSIAATSAGYAWSIDQTSAGTVSCGIKPTSAIGATTYSTTSAASVANDSTWHTATCGHIISPADSKEYVVLNLDGVVTSSVVGTGTFTSSNHIGEPAVAMKLGLDANGNQWYGYIDTVSWSDVELFSTTASVNRAGVFEKVFGSDVTGADTKLPSVMGATALWDNIGSFATLVTYAATPTKYQFSFDQGDTYCWPVNCGMSANNYTVEDGEGTAHTGGTGAHGDWGLRWDNRTTVCLAPNNLTAANINAFQGMTQGVTTPSNACNPNGNNILTWKQIDIDFVPATHASAPQIGGSAAEEVTIATTFKVRTALVAGALTDSPNIFQQGDFNDPGQFKLQIGHGNQTPGQTFPNGHDLRLQCRVKGTTNDTLADGPAINIGDAIYHSLSCTKFADSGGNTIIRVSVDGKYVDTSVAAIGDVNIATDVSTYGPAGNPGGNYQPTFSGRGVATNTDNANGVYDSFTLCRFNSSVVTHYGGAGSSAAACAYQAGLLLLP